MVKLRETVLGLCFVAVYVALDWLSFIHPMEGFNITPWNPQPALAIALLMRGGFRWLPVVYVALLASEWLGRGDVTPWPAMLLIGAVLSLGYGLIAAALRGPLAIRPALDSQRDVLRLVGVIVPGALLTGALFIVTLMACNVRPLDEPLVALVRFWIGDAVGIVVTLPLVLMLTVPARRREMRRMLARPENALHLILIASAMVLVLLVPAQDLVKFFYILFLPLIVVATRLGLIGSTFAALSLQCAIIAGAELSDYQALTIFEVQSMLLALTVTGLFLGVTVDERRRAQEELDRTTRLAAAGEMAAALAHELNQPLAAVASYARASQLIAGSRSGEYELLIDTLAKLVAESSRAAEVVRRLRDFFTTGDTQLEAVDLRTLVQHVIARLRPAFPGSSVELRQAGSVREVLADRTQLEIVVRNLIANALEASSQIDGPAVTVEVSGSAETTGAAVRDNGPGVSPQDLERIFEPFESTRATGMGMGLAISRAIIEAHGGKLWTEAGPGGHFAFSLPAIGKDHE
jgi:signal transduction histidine kinase